MMIVEEPPSGWEDFIKNNLPVLLHENTSATPDVDHFSGVEAEASVPVPVYEATTKEAAEQGLADARIKSWRSFIYSGGVVESAVDLRLSRDSGLELSVVRRGRALAIMLSAFDRAEIVAEAEEGEYAVRFLEVPGLLWGFVWLVGEADENRKRDKLFPMFESEEFDLNKEGPRPYCRGDKFEDILKEAAGRFIESSRNSILQE